MVTISGPGGEFWTANGAWAELRELAQLYGWKPKGTRHESAEDWDGNYVSNDGQVIEADDTAALTAALMRLLDEVRNEDALEFLAVAYGGSLRIY